MDTLETMIENVKTAVGDNGSCDPELVKSAINQARNLLWDKTQGPNTCEYLCIQGAQGCITLPSRYEKVVLAWSDNYPMSLSDEWYQSYTGVGKFKECDSCHLGLQEIGGRHVVFRDYTAAPYLLGVMAEHQDDRDIELTFEVRNKYGSFFNHKIITQESPVTAYGNELIVAVTRATKPETKCRIRLYAYNPTNGQKLLISIYHPKDVNPSFRRFGFGARKIERMTIFAKKKFFNLVDNQELVEFGQNAIYHAILALNARENRNTDEYVKNLSVAVQELGSQIKDEELAVSTPLNFRNLDRVDNLCDFTRYPDDNFPYWNP